MGLISCKLIFVNLKAQCIKKSLWHNEIRVHPIGARGRCAASKWRFDGALNRSDIASVLIVCEILCWHGKCYRLIALFFSALFIDTFEERILIMSKLTYSLILAGITGLTTASAFAADAAPTPEHSLTGNVGLFSQYIYRGITQTNEKPALQGGFDYAHSSGLYAGIWGSNVSWISDPGNGVSASLELDTYFGYKNSFAEDFSYDVGFLRYNYPGSYPAGFTKPDTDEIYGQLGYKWFTLKYSHSLGDTFGIANSKNTNYLDLSANFEVADKLTLGLHAGKQTFKGDFAPSVSNDSLFTYNDYKVSLTKDIGGYMVGAAYTNTNAKDEGYFIPATGKNNGRSQFVVSVSKSF
jgi:uncharacterized protein (TIGR02001 family)